MNIDHKFNFGNLSWGKTNRLAQIFPNYHEGMSHKTVMLALDHPYFMGPVSGLEDPRKEIANLARFADAFSPAKGTLEYCCDPTITTPLVLRVTGGTSMTIEDKLSDEKIITSVEEAVRLNAVGVSASVFIGTQHQKKTIENLGKLANDCGNYGLITLGITAVGAELKKMKEDEDKSNFPKYLAHAGRILQENGANIVKTYFCDGWEKVRKCIQTPIVVAGGQRTSEKDALTLTYNAIQAGADGVDMGRNIFQADNPHVMLGAIKQIVHYGKTDKEAFEYYKDKGRRDME